MNGRDRSLLCGLVLHHLALWVALRQVVASGKRLDDVRDVQVEPADVQHPCVGRIGDGEVVGHHPNYDHLGRDAGQLSVLAQSDDRMRCARPVGLRVRVVHEQVVQTALALRLTVLVDGVLDALRAIRATTGAVVRCGNGLLEVVLVAELNAQSLLGVQQEVLTEPELSIHTRRNHRHHGSGLRSGEVD